jgi:hypothetical protein
MRKLGRGRDATDELKTSLQVTPEAEPLDSEV